MKAIILYGSAEPLTASHTRPVGTGYYVRAEIVNKPPASDPCSSWGLALPPLPKPMKGEAFLNIVPIEEAK